MSSTPIKQRLPATPGKTPQRGRSRSTPPPRCTNAPSQQALHEVENSQGEEGIQVAIRMRPLNRNEGSHSRIWKVLPKYSSVAQTTVEGKPLPERIAGRNFFTFDKTFGEESSTGQVYESIAKNIVVSACTGINGTIFAYGQTSSGKTYTMQGSGTIAEGSAGTGGGGIVHMAAQDVFSHIASSPDRVFLVRASFLEIYNEEVRDLLAENRTLQVREDPRRGVFVQSKEEVVVDFDSLLGILFLGEKSRAFASTAMNERSSRSHTIFRITIESRAKSEGTDAAGNENDDGAVRVSTLNLVDLAGSESVRHTGATGDRQKEGGMINQSLLTLSRVIVGLGMPNQSHINFRDSKLTRILQPSLSGNARMAVICCATPSELYLEETRSTLLFAGRAKLVKTNAQVNEVLDDRSIILRLQRELVEARRYGGGGGAEHVKALEQRAEFAGTAVQAAEDKLKRLYGSILTSDGALFGQTQQRSIEANKRQRRLSEGNLLMAGNTPPRTQAEILIPTTLPRPFTKFYPDVVKTLSSSSEVSMLRQALAAKSESFRRVEKQRDGVSKKLQLRESELVAANCTNDMLRSDRETESAKSLGLSVDIAALRSELVVATESRETLSAEKDAAIAQALAKVEEEIQVRRILQESVDSLKDDNESLQREASTERESMDSKIAALQQEQQSSLSQIENEARSNGALQTTNKQLESNIADMQTQLDSLRKEREETVADNDTLRQELATQSDELHESNDLVESLNSELCSLRSEKDSATFRVKNLEGELQILLSESVSIKCANADLEEKLAFSATEFRELKEQLNAYTDKLHIAEKTIVARDAAITDGAVRREHDEAILTTLGRELRDSQQHVQVMQSALDLALEEKRQLTDDFTGLSQRHTSNETDMAQLKEVLDGMESRESFLKEQIDALEIERREHQEAQDSLSAERDSARVELQEKIEVLASNKSTIDEQHATIATLTSQRTAVESSFQILTEEMELLLERNLELDTKLAKEVSKNSSLDGRVIEVEAQLAIACIELDESRVNSSKGLDTMGVLQGTIAKLEVSNGLLESEKDSLSSQLSCLHDESNASDALADQLETIIKSLEVKLLSAIEERDAARVATSSMGTSQRSTEVKLEGLALVLSQSESDKHALSLEIADLRNEYAVAIARADELCATLEDCSTRHQTQIASISSESESIRSASSKTLEVAQTIVDGLVVALCQALSKENAFATEVAEMSVQKAAAIADTDQLTRRLENFNRENIAQLAAAEAECDVAKQKIEAMKSFENEMALELQSALMRLESVSSEKAVFEANLLCESRELQSAKDELLSIHDDLELSKRRFNDLRQRKNDLEDELESKEAILSQSMFSLDEEKKLLAAAFEASQSDLRALNVRLGDLVAEKDELVLELHALRDTSPCRVDESVIEEMRCENNELKLLLASSNRMVEEAMEATSVATLQVDNKNRLLEQSYERIATNEQGLDGAMDKSSGRRNSAQDYDELQTVLEEKNNLVRRLEAELDDRKTSETVLKRQMSDERRELIHDAEKMMQGMRLKLVTVTQAKESSDAEGYEARKMKEELEDRSVQLESKVAALENENTRLRRSTNRQDFERDSDLAALRETLQRAKSDRIGIQKVLNDLEKKLDRANDEKKFAERETAMALEKLSIVNTQELDDENRRLAAEVDKLTHDATDLQTSFKEEKASSAEQISDLHAEVKRLRQKLQSKDGRIKKLEESKLTRDKLNVIQKIMADNKGFIQEIKNLKAEIENLRNSLVDQIPLALEDTELTKLRFDKQALENKLRKFAAHCQTLEDEKCRLREVLRSVKPDDVDDDGIEKAIVNLCDKLASLEEECDALAKAEKRASVHHAEVDTLRIQNAEFVKKIDSLLRFEAGQKESIASLTVELLELRVDTDRFRVHALSQEAEKSSKLRFLEQESVELYADLKATKKQLQNAKAELNILRAQSVVLQPATAENTSCSRENAGQKRTRTPANKENSKNDAENSTIRNATRATSSSRETRRAAALGEAFAPSEESTQECKQS